ncbi:MAG: hydrogenase maturation nickel metallochaperone HypA [Candidatus Bathyarchaeia archaeon]|nr:hydrogenase maturation nickel metallochaperone HypA [Candidatus Bathyarchaeota archaeon A05DMB-4]MDH7595443.1 hydrogenase maturation nickel metallochaperone HypA [Candidatus Bathyarchaeota archaeon]
MHEGSITTQVVKNVLQEANKRNAKKVVEVQLVIGKLTFLNPEQVRFWYEILTKDTIMKGSRLIIEESEGVVKCPKCGYEGDFKYVDDPAMHVPTPTLNCPKCGGTVEMVGGKDCLIKNIKMMI